MTQLDERLLEILRDEGPSSTALLAERLHLTASEGRIRDRLHVLAHAEFVAPFGGVIRGTPDWWVLAGKGREYLRGELDAQYHHPPPGHREDVGGRTTATVAFFP
jgi:hypothetical protein